MPASELEAAWRTQRTPRIAANELFAGVDALFQYHERIGLFEPAIQGMRHLALDPASSFEAMHVPNRWRALIAQKERGGSPCVLLNPPRSDQRGLGWRSYIVWPNAFPYLPLEQRPVVIASSRYIEQQFSQEILGDMIDFQRSMSGGGPATLLYNGFAGNSERQLHWHACRTTFPLERLLNEGRAETSVLRREQNGALHTFDHGFYAGVLVEGDRAFVTRWADRIVRRIEQDTGATGLYNLALLNPRAERVRLVVFPRRTQPLAGDDRETSLGAIDLLGMLVSGQDSIPTDLVKEKIAKADRHRVRPRDLPWLPGLAAAPRVLRP